MQDAKSSEVVTSKYCAKCKKDDLRRSSFAIPHKMVRPFRQGEWPWKYLTIDQADQVRRYNIPTFDLGQSDLDFLERRKTQLKDQKIIVQLPKTYEKTVVYYKDEDGSAKCEFKSHSDAIDFINHNIARVSSGEKFEVEDVIDMYKLIQLYQSFYFTFGCGIDDPHRNCYTVIEAETDDARDIMFNRFGNKWSMQYTEDQWMIDPNNPKNTTMLRVSGYHGSEPISQAEMWHLKKI